MNGCQHTDEHMNGYGKAVNDNIDDKTANQRERGERGDRNRPKIKNKEKHRRGKTLTLVFACFFFP